MVFHLPNEQDLRTRINYTQAFALTMLWNIGLLGMLIAFLFILSFLVKKYQLRINKNQALRETMVTAESRNSDSQMTERQSANFINSSEFANPKTKVFKTFNFLTSLFFYTFWVVVALIYLTFFMFNYFGRGTHVDLLSVFVMTLAVVLPTLLWKYKTKVTSLSQLRGEIIFTVVLLVLWLGVSVFSVVATKGACVCYYNDKFGISVDADQKLSTDFTRSFYIDKVCPDSQICHLYATVAEDASTSVFFNAHTGMDLNQLTFTLTQRQQIIETKQSTSPFKLDNVDSLGQRNVHSVIFQNLIPNTTYSIEVANKEGTVLKRTFYKTVPNATASEVRLAMGGDLGMNKNGITMTSYLSSYNPDIIILGGDTVYDNGMRSCYYSWDIFYGMFEPVYESLNRLVPLVMSVGNHDVGFDALTQTSITATQEEMPLFFIFNPQHSSPNNPEQIPPYLERESVHYHIIGSTIHLNLDSGYLKGFKDQVHFIRSIVQSHLGYYRFANYHNPIYPSCTNSQPGSNDMLVINEGLKHWTPLFDQFNFTASMEHHTHFRKMTYKIYNDSLSNDRGTRYIGDGSWGVTEMTCTQDNLTPKANLLQNYKNTNPNHMWQVTVRRGSSADKPYSINYTAVDLTGSVVVQQIEDLPNLG